MYYYYIYLSIPQSPIKENKNSFGQCKINGSKPNENF